MDHNQMDKFISVKGLDGAVRYFDVSKIVSFGKTFKHDQKDYIGSCGYIQIEGMTYHLSDSADDIHEKIKHALAVETPMIKNKQEIPPVQYIPSDTITDYETWLDTPIEKNLMGARIANSFLKAGYKTWRDVEKASDRELLNIRAIGINSVITIHDALEKTYRYFQKTNGGGHNG